MDTKRFLEYRKMYPSQLVADWTLKEKQDAYHSLYCDLRSTVGTLCCIKGRLTTSQNKIKKLEDEIRQYKMEKATHNFHLHKADYIRDFSIVADNENLPKITFKSNEAIANAVRLALINDSNYWSDIQLNFEHHPVVNTTIYLIGPADIDNFLALNSVRVAFINGML